jgi:hypothetical protein
MRQQEVAEWKANPARLTIKRLKSLAYKARFLSLSRAGFEPERSCLKAKA